MASTEFVGVKLTETEADAIDQLVSAGYFKSRSDVIREGLGMVFNQFKLKAFAATVMKQERKFHFERRRKRKSKRSQMEVFDLPPDN